mgnify:CR=1 FL=1|jgi:hypothetical protein
MAVVAPVPGSLTTGTSVSVLSGTAGEALTEGQVLYNSGGSLYKADNSTAAKATAVGVAIAPAASGKPVFYVGAVNMELITGGTFVQNTWYVVGSTAGTIELYSDMGSGEYLTWLGYGNSDGNLVWKNIVTGTTKP